MSYNLLESYEENLQILRVKNDDSLGNHLKMREITKIKDGRIEEAQKKCYVTLFSSIFFLTNLIFKDGYNCRNNLKQSSNMFLHNFLSKKIDY